MMRDLLTPELIIQIATIVGSLLGVLGVAWLAKLMKLGQGHDRVWDVPHAIKLAEEAECGFAGTRADIDKSGFGAIVYNDRSQAMLVRAHGNKFVARRIGPEFYARLGRHWLYLDSGDWGFAGVALEFGPKAGVIASHLRGVL